MRVQLYMYIYVCVYTPESCYSIIGERQLNNNRRRMSFNEDIVPIVSLREMIRTMIAAAAVAVVS